MGEDNGRYIAGNAYKGECYRMLRASAGSAVLSVLQCAHAWVSQLDDIVSNA